MKAFIVSIMLLCATPAWAEHNLMFSSEKLRKAADITSTGLVLTNITGDVVTAFQSDNRKENLLHAGCRYAIAGGSAMLAKHYIPRPRPDWSDNQSFFSMHSSLAFASKWRAEISIPIAIGTAGGRVLAGKHHLTDTLVGAGAGLFSRWICR
jgi:membrane-associated phospholipid phosphatase